MGTRSLTVFIDSNHNDEEIAVIYKQFDGYPEGHGKDLAEFLAGKTLVDGISGKHDESQIFNGTGCLAASVVTHFKNRPGDVYLCPAGTRDTGEEYIYMVYGKTDGPVCIKILDYNSKVLVDGPASKVFTWIEDSQE